MAPSNSGGGGDPLSPEAAAAVSEGLGLVLGRWTALQMAVQNQWGGRDSRAKADQLGASILSLLCRSKDPDYYELVDMMYDTISESFNADFDDGSIEEVAEKLLIMHKECQQRNYSSVEELRNSHVQGSAVSQSRQIVVDDNNVSDSSSNEDDASMMDDDEAPEGMAVDKPKSSKPASAEGMAVDKPKSSKPAMDDEAAAPEGMAVDKPKSSKPVPDADGWTVVPSRRGRGKK